MEKVTLKKVFIPSDKESALAMGSGDLQVLSTPCLIASLENVAMNCIKPQIPEGYTTVGTLMNLKHMKASKIGQPYTAEAILEESDGRRFVFQVIATDEAGNVLGKGIHERFMVNVERFLGKL